MDSFVHSLLGLDLWTAAAVAAVFAASGAVRGFAGGIGANFLTAPVLGVLLGPREAVPIILLVNMVGNAQLMPRVLAHVRWREGWPIFLFPALTVPLGAAVLLTVDEDVMRRAIAGAAAAFSLLMLSGWRYRGRHLFGLSVAAGSASGVLAGAVSIGGPPIFLYLMAGGGNAATNRAQFVMYGNFACAAALATFLAAGVVTVQMLLFAALLAAPTAAGIWLGDRLFRRTGEEAFRRVTLWGLAAVSLCILVL